jgi:predicted secreted protein
MFVTNSGAYYTDVNNNKHEIILDKEARGFWRDQWGNSHRLEVENDSRSVYFIETSGDFHSLNVDSFGRLSVTDQMTGRLEDVNIDQHGRAYYTNS